MAGTDMSGYCEGSSSSERFNTITSSDKVDNTRNELEHQEQVIVQSGKLLGKYELVHLDVNCGLDGLRVLHHLINRGYYDQYFSLRDATVSIKIVESNENHH
ncbi:uncharacterized protein LOC105180891 isoform X3 [Harpegnathos saltator]|uniref:uncharacterized protein LOC105180891 isoform X3 n=1 Tax=Harpegnathos saltator TaxID=610380 RepID=UPI000DBEE0DB|nr:uncharacterized protein LOC105180891 isoform X3 [Harpegnathos saltator]